jgi:uncharacterized protein YqjF (DUF2071 family)
MCRAIVTVVGLRMRNTCVAGVPVPFQQDLEQVNLRFYVWRREGAEMRPGVVFLKEIVPSALMAVGARLLYHENYSTATMRHEVAHAQQGWVSYEWRCGARWNRVSAMLQGTPRAATPRSIEAFIKDRPWGYTRQPNGATLEYRVEHPAWDIWSGANPVLDCDAAAFGTQFRTTLSRPPVAAFVAVGSVATIHPGHVLD